MEIQAVLTCRGGECAFFRVDQGRLARQGEAGCHGASFPGVMAFPATGPAVRGLDGPFPL